MRVSLQWLKEYIDLPTDDPEDLSRAFDMLGHTVESAESLEADWTKVLVGRVLSVEAHPDADRVRVTSVDVGEGEPYQIICGAWNFEAGAVVPVALPGAVLPGGFEIGRRPIRGVESNGMICSEQELGLGEDHDGIMVLSEDTPIGDPFADHLELPDVVFELEITNNRPDVMSMVGVARELAAWYDTSFREPTVSLETIPGEPRVSIAITAADGCNRFTAREVRGVTIGKSPLWMRERLRKAGVRSISNAVDVTNYVMMELGHPLHAFDADRIAEQSLEVRWANSGEALETLDGNRRDLTSEDLIIADGAGPTSLAAIMGGARSEVADSTTSILMEAAHWNPATVMYASRRQDLQSEASKRFERGVDPHLAPYANDRACQLLSQVGGGEIIDTQIDVVANHFEKAEVDLATRDVARMLGDRFNQENIAGLLRRLHLTVQSVDAGLNVTVPTNRPDLTRPADLIEEVARLADFDTFDETLPTGPAGGLSPVQMRTRALTAGLAGLGLHQAVNLPFVAADELNAFAGEIADVVSVRNPLRDDQAKLRQSLLPGLLRNLRENRNRGAASVPLFEVGRVFFARPWDEDGRVPEQPDRLAVAVAGPFGMGGPGRLAPEADASTALGLVSAMAKIIGRDISRTPAQPAGYHPARTAELSLDGVRVGFAGEVHPDVAASFEIDARVAVVEVDLGLLTTEQPTIEMQPISTYPHVDFDLSFEVPPSLAGADLVLATERASSLVEDVEVFDDFINPDSGVRSIAIRYRLRATDRTLARQEIDNERDAFIAAAASLGAKLRGS